MGLLPEKKKFSYKCACGERKTIIKRVQPSQAPKCKHGGVMKLDSWEVVKS